MVGWPARLEGLRERPPLPPAPLNPAAVNASSASSFTSTTLDRAIDLCPHSGSQLGCALCWAFPPPCMQLRPVSVDDECRWSGPGEKGGVCLEEGRRWVVLSYGRGARNKWAAVAAIVTTKQADATVGSGSIACRGSLGGLTDRGSTPRNHHTGRWFSGIPTQYIRVTLRGALRVPRQGRADVWLCRNPSGVKKKQSPRPPPPNKPFLTPPNRRRGFDRSWACQDASWLHG